MNWSHVAGFLVGVSWTLVVLMIASFLHLRAPEEPAEDPVGPLTTAMLSGHSGGSRPD